jgi:hypothetical protein
VFDVEAFVRTVIILAICLTSGTQVFSQAGPAVPARPYAPNADNVPVNYLVSPTGEPFKTALPQKHLFDAAFGCESHNYLDLANDALEHGADPNLVKPMPVRGLYGMDKSSALGIASYLAEQNESKMTADAESADSFAPIPDSVYQWRDAAANCREMIRIMKAPPATTHDAGNQAPVYASFSIADGKKISSSWGAALSASLQESSAAAKRMCEDKTKACRPAGSCQINPTPGRTWSVFVSNGDPDRPASGFACGYPTWEEAESRAYRACWYGPDRPRSFHCTAVWARSSDTLVAANDIAAKDK